MAASPPNRGTPPCQFLEQHRRRKPFPTQSAVETANDGDDFLPASSVYNKFVNWCRMLSGSMSPKGQTMYWEDVDQRYSKIDCQRCEKQRDYLLQYSPIIRFMNNNIARLGGDVGRHNIRCMTCPNKEEWMQGGFDHEYGIKICANIVDKQSVLEDVMAHEMVHAYDVLRFKTELAADEDLRKVACSEVSRRTCALQS
jgi:mitochondrial inner membrane protease ATP23